MTQSLIELHGISLAYGPLVVLDAVNWVITRGARIGLIGENGAGKTTLARILLGQLEPDSGLRRPTPGLTLGHLPQAPEFSGPGPGQALTVRSYLANAAGDLDRLRGELAELEDDLAQPSRTAEQRADLLARYGATQALFAARGGYDGEHRLDEVRIGLGLAQVAPDRAPHTLSGGEQTRLVLAGLLLRAPDLLVLDEPTNHLDQAALDWLAAHLSRYSGAVVLISHNRRFLNRTVNAIAELSAVSRGLTQYLGNYDAYRVARARADADRQAAFEQQQAEMKELHQLIKHKQHSAGSGRGSKDVDKFAKGFFRGRNEVRQGHEIRKAKRRLQDLTDHALERPTRRWQINPTLVQPDVISQDVIQFEGVHKAYGPRTVLAGVSGLVHGGERVVLLGPNGSGKTTLIRVLLGMEAADAGRVRLAAGVRVGFLDQLLATLELTQTVLEAFSQGLIGTEPELRARLHRYGLFADDEAHQPVGTLSLGQRRKLQIARLVATEPTLLVLDEPTNHLDLASVEQFETALCGFQGTVLAITHDATFAEHVATRLWRLKDGQL
ncbi:MAG: ABC-F family ATP-binding cassette domain-containing protein, partial [Anaerolineales bacterium]|nr:ABC-F family ATP-binding cassette domain-containing protein [Anaerolineales bacterium]